MFSLWLSNHPCSDEQREEMKEKFGCPVRELSPEAKKLWGSVPPAADMEDVMDLFFRILEIERIVLRDHQVKTFAVMGELSLCVAAIQVGALFNIRACTPTTLRKSTEETVADGSVRKTNVFRHCRIRTML